MRDKLVKLRSALKNKIHNILKEFLFKVKAKERRRENNNSDREKDVRDNISNIKKRLGVCRFQQLGFGIENIKSNTKIRADLLSAVDFYHGRKQNETSIDCSGHVE
jgi:hypothetical protein